MKRTGVWLSALLALSAPACVSEDASSTRVSAGAEDDAPEPGLVPKHDFVFVFLVTGSNPPTLDEQGMAEVMKGHFANMRRLAEEGTLVLAGPLGEPRSEPGHRGIFVFDVPTVEDALALASTDPALQAGVMEARAFPWRSATPLRRLFGMHQEAERELGPSPNPGAHARGYVLASTKAIDERELDRLSEQPTVVLAGLFGGERAGTAIIALAVETIPDAQAALLAMGGEPEEWTCFPLFASKFLLEI
jgi:uncharacterized protein YciI